MPVQRNISLYRGDTWSETYVFFNDPEATDPTDLSAAEVRAQIRPTAGGTLTAELSCTVAGVDNNQVIVKLLPAQWGSFPSNFSKGVWDLEVEFDPENIKTYVKGSVTVEADVTQEVIP